MIISIGGTKGGTGKTTLAINLAIMRSLTGREVLLVDADEQGSSAKFTSLRNSERHGGAGYACIRLLEAEVADQVPELREKYDDIIIDAGGRDTDSHKYALGVSDIAILPFRPSSFDVWELANASKIVHLVRPANRRLQAYAILNQADSVGNDNAEAGEFAAGVKNIRYFAKPVVSRKAFGRASANGLSVVELSGKFRDAKATRELYPLYELVFGEQFAQPQRAGNE